MAAFFREPGVVEDPGLDGAVRRNAGQRDLAHFGQHGLVGPRRLAHEMQQRLVFRRGSRRRGQRGHGLDTLPIAGQQQAGTVVVQRHHAVGMADHAGEVVDVGFEPQTAGLTVRCELDTRSYPKGIKVSNAEMATLNITGDAFHPEWNYTIAPKVPS